jgi:hypothetical protein
VNRTGTINFFESHIGLWEETVDEPAMRRVLRSILARLTDHRGWKFVVDPEVAAKYPRLARTHFYGRKGDLECNAETVGRTIRIEFFQNVANVDNPHGGRYCSQKFQRMPRPMQLACAIEMAHVLRKAVELGYVLEGRRHGITSTDLLAVLRHAEGRTDENNPLAKFNRGWNFDSDWERGGRFERDADGWPSAKEYAHWPARDRDGVRIRSGDVVYVRHEGRLFRGIARPNMNDMWIVISPATASAPATLVYETARRLFRCEHPDQEPRRLIPNQAGRLTAELDAAVKAKRYPRVVALARTLEALAS